MEQEDYLKRQIDQLGRVLGKILADLIGLKTQGQASSSIEATDQALKNELGLNLNDLTSIPPVELINILQADKKLSTEIVEELAEILFLIAEDIEQNSKANKKKQEFYERSLILYEYADTSGTTYSFDRHLKIANIKNLIDKQD